MIVVNKTYITRDQKWSKGYIRFTSTDYYGQKFPDWQIDGALEAIILHEFGHVLGLMHEPGTIMDGALIAQLFQLFEGATLKPISTAIDQAQELIQCEKCDQTFRIINHPDNQKILTELNPLENFSQDSLKLVIADSSVTLQSGDKKLAIADLEKQTIDQSTVLKSNFPDHVKSEKFAYIFTGKLFEKNILVLVNASGLPAEVHLEMRIAKLSGKADVLRFKRDSSAAQSVQATPRASSRPRNKSISNVALMDDERAILCKGSDGSGQFKLWMDPKDREMKVTRSGKVEIFRSQRFLDHAVLFKSEKSEDWAWFQIFEDSNPMVILGRAQDFKESSCEDTGNSKRCQISAQSTLTWTPEYLEDKTEGRDKSVFAPIRRYGTFPNDGTYFLAESAEKNTLALLDLGSELKLVKGSLSQLTCVYE